MNTRLLGAMGEQSAARYLRGKGYDIFTANFSVNTGEIDIIALKNNILCFVEVKTRREGGMFAPAEAVGYRKTENIKSAASAYMNRYGFDYEYRFDIVEVLVDENMKVTSINHIENAF